MGCCAPPDRRCLALMDVPPPRQLIGQVRALPAKQRVALELAHLVGLSCDEISVLMQCPVNTVKTRMFHGRRNLQRANDAQCGQMS